MNLKLSIAILLDLTVGVMLLAVSAFADSEPIKIGGAFALTGMASSFGITSF